MLAILLPRTLALSSVLLTRPLALSSFLSGLAQLTNVLASSSARSIHGRYGAESRNHMFTITTPSVGNTNTLKHSEEANGVTHVF